MNILVIFGGVSPEHDVSCVSAASVLSNINRAKHSVSAIGITAEGRWLWVEPDPDLLRSGDWVKAGCPEVLFSPNRGEDGGFFISGTHYMPDVVFPVLHGENGEDGKLQGMLSLAGIPFVGCGTASAALTMDKVFTHQVCEYAGIPMADWVFVSSDEVTDSLSEVIARVEAKFSYPVFVKPANTGSSVGVSKAASPEKLAEALREAARYDRRILVEEFIDGRELEVAVLGNNAPEASCVGEILPSREFYSYESKYVDGTSGLVLGADLPAGKTEEIRNIACRVYTLLDCKCLSRVDFFLRRSDNCVIFNEINTLPGFTNISMYPKLMERIGVSYGDLIERLLAFAVETGIR